MIKLKKNGKVVQVSKANALVECIVNDALNGNSLARKICMEMMKLEIERIKKLDDPLVGLLNEYLTREVHDVFTEVEDDDDIGLPGGE